MEGLGISSSQKVGDNRIHTLHAFSGWYVDGIFVKNPFATRRNADGTAIVTAEVPPAKVITIEVPDGRNKSAEGSDSDFYNSRVSSLGAVPSADGHVSHTSPQSNERGDVGKYVTDGKSSVSSHNNISPQSADIPSSLVEADGSQKDNASRTQSQTRLSYAETQLILSNEGKRKDKSSARQEEQPPQLNRIASEGNNEYHQMSDNYCNPNGSHNND